MKNFNLLIVHFNLLRSSLKGKGAENRRITHLSATLQNYPLRGKNSACFFNFVSNRSRCITLF